MIKPTRILDWGRVYDLGDTFGDARLLGFEVAVVSSGIHGVKVKLTATPPHCTRIHLEENDTEAK